MSNAPLFVWPYPFPPIMGGSEESATHIHIEKPVESVEHATEHLADETKEAIETAVEAAANSPSGAVAIPHDVAAKLGEYGVLHEQQQERIQTLEAHNNALESRLAALEGSINNVTASAENAVEAAVDVPQTVAEETLELPEEVIAPRRVHAMRQGWWPKWL